MSIDKLFEPARIGALTIKNRFVRSATSETMSRDDGVITEDYSRLYLDIARGGAGLIFTGHIYVHPRGRYIGRQAGIHDDAVIEPYKRFTKRIHDAGGTIFGELGHAGSQSRDPAVTPLAPSPVENFISARRPTAASEADIEEAIDAFGQGARRLREAGFDGVHVHAGHGYLISEFSSPHANRRDDDWGGDAERRGRFVLEVYRAIRRQVGDDFPVTFKLGMADSMDEGGLAVEESLPRAAQLETEGLDAIEVSVGIMHLLTKSSGEFIGVSPGRAWRDLVIHRLWTPAGEECYFRDHAESRAQGPRADPGDPGRRHPPHRDDGRHRRRRRRRLRLDVAALHPRARPAQPDPGRQARPRRLRLVQHLPRARGQRADAMLARRQAQAAAPCLVGAARRPPRALVSVRPRATAARHGAPGAKAVRTSGSQEPHAARGRLPSS